MGTGQLAAQIFSVVFLLLIAAGVFYAFSQHILIFNRCPVDSTLVETVAGPVCYPSLNDTVIVKGSAYTLNSSIAVSDGRVIPLDFRFLGNQSLMDIWNQNESQSSGTYVFLTIPDTFKVHMQYRSNTDLQFLVMSDSEFVDFYRTGTANSEFSASGQNLSVWFNDSAGCAGYVAIIRAVDGGSFFIQPNETALYAPATGPTGICI